MEDRFVVVRPAEYSVAPQYRATVVESHLSKYVLEVDPLAFDETRCSWAYRSPGLGTLQSSTVEMAFTIRVRSRLAINYIAQLGPQFQIVDAFAATAVGGPDISNPHTCSAGPACKIAFGSGDAMQKAISSMQISVNGAALAQTRQRDYMRSLQKCWFDKDVFQKRFNECGGTPQQYDANCVSGELLNIGDGDRYEVGRAVTQKLCGFTGDSGVRNQLKNVLACQIDAPVNAAPANFDERDIRIRWKINGTGLLNPLARGDKVSSSCPYRSSARALPHMNIVNININFVSLFRCLIRNLSSVNGIAGAGGAQTLAGGGNNEIHISFPPTAVGGANPKLYVEFLRLPSWRQQSGTALIQTFRVACHDPTTDKGQRAVVIPAANLDATADVENCLLPCGVDRLANGPAAQFLGGEHNSYRTCEWNGISSAQLPQYLFCVLEKSPEMFVASDLGGNAAGKKWTSSQDPATALVDFPNTANTSRAMTSIRNQYLARNTDSNAAITQFQLEIMSVQGSYVYSAEKWPYIKTRSDLYRDVSKYCIDSYDDQDTWFKHNCIVMLGCEEFAKGISSSGTAFPCTFKVKCQFENHRNYIDGYGCVGVLSTGLGACQDVIGGRPVLGFIFPQQSLQLSASSALLSSQNISHSSAMELLSRG